jgi:hypothetical protein
VTLRDTQERDSLYDLVLTAQVLTYLFRNDSNESSSYQSISIVPTYQQNPFGFQTLLSCLMISKDEGELMLDFQKFKAKYQSGAIKEEPAEDEEVFPVHRKRETGIVRV